MPHAQDFRNIGAFNSHYHLQVKYFIAMLLFVLSKDISSPGQRRIILPQTSASPQH